MRRGGCQRCGASVLHGVAFAWGVVILDPLPLSTEQEAAVRLEHLTTGGRDRMTFGLRPEGTLSNRLLPEARVDKTYTPELHVTIHAEHRCGSWTARTIPPPKRSERVMPGPDDEPPYPPFADQLGDPWPDDTPIETILTTIANGLRVEAGKCIGCSLRVTGKRTACSTCSAHHHGRLYAEGQLTSDWCQTGRHRRRTALVDTEGRWSCGPCQTKAARVPSQP